MIDTRYRPEPGETVLIVPQTWYHLMNLGDPRHLVGKSPTVISEYIERGYGPYFKRYTADMATWRGYGFMVVRHGKLALGSTNWDSRD